MEKFIYLSLAILYGFGILTALSVSAWVYQDLMWTLLAIVFVGIMVALSKVWIKKYARDYWNWVLSDE